MSRRFLAPLLSVLIPVLAHAELPVLKVVTSDYPPYQYLEDGKVKGTHTEILRNVLSKMGYHPDIRIVPWARAEASTRAGSSDMIYSLTHSQDRARHYYFTDPISEARDVFFKLSGRDLQWQELDDLAGLRIGLSASYSYDPTFMDWLAAGNARVVPISQESPELTGLRMTAYGRIDLFICEETVCRHLIDKHIATHPELENVVAMPETVGSVRGFRAAFSRRHPEGEELRDEFNRVLSELKSGASSQRP
ncbi:transporter substrate-binding domain-containing protein [Marinobacter sp. 71-i]|uniref:Transporter substrate-binding domain-containing protein n=1 Tax=Marinobacter iranensis TaxID=2962607 RepID=A0ABT5Y6T1_9GAMM|nr:transporter substrate-binding domain-containing protein [Marinobacter iranensis]MDF0749387.1 transporter substrate-binding domain-containing protein [Marinobacter iranensis]